MLREVWAFFKNPQYIKYPALPTNKKWGIFFNLLKWSIILCFGIGILTGIILLILGLPRGNHAIEELIKFSPVLEIFFWAVLFAPLTEELLFRAPLVLFKNKNYFRYIFYLSAILFALVHLLNFDFEEPIIWLAPLIVMPQFIAGIFMGFIRIKMGLIWSVLLHATFNGLLLSPFIIMKLLKVDMI